MTSDPPPRRDRLGGLIHSYQRYDPQRFPSPTQPEPDVASAAMEHMLRFGSMRRLTDEELAEAIHLDPSQIAGLGPSLDALIEMLEERKRKILETYETSAALHDAAHNYVAQSSGTRASGALGKRLEKAVRHEQIRGLRALWYEAEKQDPRLAAAILRMMESLGDKYEVEELDARYDFTGRTKMSVEKALEVKEELETIDRLLEQLREAMKNAQIAVIDLEELGRFVEEADVEQLRGLQEQIEDYMREQAEAQGLEMTREGYRLTPKAYRIAQSKLLERIFSELEASCTGRHTGPVTGEGAVETPKTQPYEFGDSLTHMDISSSFVNAMIREAGERADRSEPRAPARGRGPHQDGCGAAAPTAPPRVRLAPEDIEVHATRNTPKCATTVLMDMSGSMRHGGQYVNCKRMALALDGLIRSEYPGDFLQCIEIATFARARHISEVPQVMPKPVTIHQPVVRLKVDMSRDDVTESMIPPHFTNIQHGLRLSRQFLAARDTPNRQIILITDGLPTAHFEDETLFLLYPPDPATEEATMREAFLCQRDGITINIFLLPNWWQTHEDVAFAQRMAEATRGRVFFTGGEDLDRFVLWDYVAQRRSVIG